MLAVAYASNVGGIGTKIGTVPSAQLSGFLAQRAPRSAPEFMAIGAVRRALPAGVRCALQVGRPDAPMPARGARHCEQQTARLAGPARRKVVLGVFLATAALWIAAKPIVDWPAQAWLRSRPRTWRPALLGAAPCSPLARGRPSVLALRRCAPCSGASRGAGGALLRRASGERTSQWLGAQLSTARYALLQTVVVAVVTVTLSAFASNAATVAVLLPVLASSIAPDILHPVLFASTFAASCDFALPAGTPPNAIVFLSGYISIPLMVRTGVRLDLVAALLVALWCYFAVPFVL
jgi:sodium-dependent dicarboxylate transporter 2/3/5